MILADLHSKSLEHKVTRRGLVAYWLASKINSVLGKEVLPSSSPIAPHVSIAEEIARHMELGPLETSVLCVGFLSRASQPDLDTESSPTEVIEVVRTAVAHHGSIAPDRKEEVDHWVGIAALAGFSLGSLFSASEIRYDFVRKRMEKLGLEVIKLRPADEKLNQLTIPIETSVNLSARIS